MRASGVRNSCDSTARNSSLRRGRRFQLDDRLFVLPGPVVLSKQRVAEDLEQLAVQQQAPFGHRRLPPHDLPEPVERQPCRPGPALDGWHLGESSERVTRHRSAHDRAFEHQRRADDRQAVALVDDHRRSSRGLHQAAARAFGEQARIDAVFPEQRSERREMRQAENHLPVDAEQLHAQPGGLGVFVERRFPEIGAEQRAVHTTSYFFFSGAAGCGGRRSGAREIRP
jgi:hypothetical protein